MTSYTKIKCACGAVTTEIQIVDLALNFDAAGSKVTCSASCDAVRSARLSWFDAYATA